MWRKKKMALILYTGRACGFVYTRKKCWGESCCYFRIFSTLGGWLRATSSLKFLGQSSTTGRRRAPRRPRESTRNVFVWGFLPWFTLQEARIPWASRRTMESYSSEPTDSNVRWSVKSHLDGPHLFSALWARKDYDDRQKKRKRKANNLLGRLHPHLYFHPPSSSANSGRSAVVSPADREGRILNIIFVSLTVSFAVGAQPAAAAAGRQRDRVTATSSYRVRQQRRPQRPASFFFPVCPLDFTILITKWEVIYCPLFLFHGRYSRRSCFFFTKAEALAESRKLFFFSEKCRLNGERRRKRVGFLYGAV